MLVEVHGIKSEDIVADASPIKDEGFPLYYSNMKVTAPVDTWGVLPEAEAGVKSVTPWGTVVMKLRNGEAVSHEDVAFLNTGVSQPLFKVAFSPVFGAGYALLTVVKHHNFESMAEQVSNPGQSEPAILQQWLIPPSLKDRPPVLINRLIMSSGSPKALCWTELNDTHGLLMYVTSDFKFRMCSVTYGLEPTAIVHEEIFMYNAVQANSCAITRLSESKYRLLLGTLTGEVHALDLNINTKVAEVRSQAAYFINPCSVTALTFMPTSRGTIFAAGLSTGSCVVCDIRSFGSPQLFQADYMAKPMFSMEWPAEYGAIMAVQNDGLIMSISMAETSRHNFTRGYPTGRKSGGGKKGPEHDYWTRLIHPPYRTTRALKAMELPATDVSTAGPICAFTFDNGVVLTGEISQLDMKAYLDASLFMYSFIDDSPGEPAALCETKSDTVKHMLERVALRASNRGLHVLKCAYFAFEHELLEFYQSGESAEFTLKMAENGIGLKIASVSGSKSASRRLFAYGSQLGIIQLHEVA